MKKTLLFVVFASLLTACQTNQTGPASVTDAGPPENPAMNVTINNFIPFKNDAKIATNIKTECQINQQLSEFIRSYGHEHNIAVARSKKINTGGEGHVLSVEIVNAVSQGNPFIGHRKYTEVAGTLYENGKEVASFTGARFSGGGFFGGYKGSCSVLGRTVKALGSDIALWLTAPIDGHHLGDSI